MPSRSFQCYSLVWYLGFVILLGTMPAMGPLFPGGVTGSFQAGMEGVELAMLTLVHAPRLSSSALGYGSATSPEGAAWRLLTRRPDAQAQFNRLLRRPGPIGQLYALIWLRDVDPGRFEKEAARLTPANREIEVQRGCVIETLTFNQIVADIREGEWGADLRVAPRSRL